MIKSSLIVAASIFCALILFQNCGGDLKSNSWGTDGESGGGSFDGSSLAGGGSPNPNLPATPNFQKGDAFNYASVPKPSQLVQTELTILNYANYTAGSKAVAINSMGNGFVSIKDGGTQEEATKTALEGCYALGGGLPCTVLAEGNKFAVSGADLATSYTQSMTVPSTISEATIPFVRLAERAGVASKYNAAASPKALAVSVDGAYFWVGGSGDSPAASLAEAKRLAMERCELTASITPCTLFAENSTVVFNPAAINRTPVIDYSRTMVQTNLPGTTDANFSTAIVNGYLPKVTTSNHGVVYFTRGGNGGYGFGTTVAAADAAALTECNLRTTSAFPCVRYATDKTVQSASAMLLGLQRSLANHCDAVPRVNCAAHKAMGCSAGMRYVMDGATPKLENCM